MENAKKILTSIPEKVEEAEEVVQAAEKVVVEVKPVVGTIRSLFCCGK